MSSFFLSFLSAVTPSSPASEHRHTASDGHDITTSPRQDPDPAVVPRRGSSTLTTSSTAAVSSWSRPSARPVKPPPVRSSAAAKEVFPKGFPCAAPGGPQGHDSSSSKECRSGFLPSSVHHDATLLEVYHLHTRLPDNWAGTHWSELEEALQLLVHQFRDTLLPLRRAGGTMDEVSTSLLLANRDDDNEGREVLRQALWVQDQHILSAHIRIPLECTLVGPHYLLNAPSTSLASAAVLPRGIPTSPPSSLSRSACLTANTNPAQWRDREERGGSRPSLSGGESRSSSHHQKKNEVGPPASPKGHVSLQWLLLEEADTFTLTHQLHQYRVALPSYQDEAPPEPPMDATPPSSGPTHGHRKRSSKQPATSSFLVKDVERADANEKGNASSTARAPSVFPAETIYRLWDDLWAIMGALFRQRARLFPPALLVNDPDEEVKLELQKPPPRDSTGDAPLASSKRSETTSSSSSSSSSADTDEDLEVRRRRAVWWELQPATAAPSFTPKLSSPALEQDPSWVPHLGMPSSSTPPHYPRPVSSASYGNAVVEFKRRSLGRLRLDPVAAQDSSLPSSSKNLSDHCSSATSFLCGPPVGPFLPEDIGVAPGIWSSPHLVSQRLMHARSGSGAAHARPTVSSSCRYTLQHPLHPLLFSGLRLAVEVPARNATSEWASDGEKEREQATWPVFEEEAATGGEAVKLGSWTYEIEGKLMTLVPYLAPQHYQAIRLALLQREERVAPHYPRGSIPSEGKGSSSSLEALLRCHFLHDARDSGWNAAILSLEAALSGFDVVLHSHLVDRKSMEPTSRVAPKKTLRQTSVFQDIQLAVQQRLVAVTQGLPATSPKEPAAEGCYPLKVVIQSQNFLYAALQYLAEELLPRLSRHAPTTTSADRRGAASQYPKPKLPPSFDTERQLREALLKLPPLTIAAGTTSGGAAARHEDPMAASSSVPLSPQRLAAEWLWYLHTAYPPCPVVSNQQTTTTSGVDAAHKTDPRTAIEAGAGTGGLAALQEYFSVWIAQLLWEWSPSYSGALTWNTEKRHACFLRSQSPSFLRVADSHRATPFSKPSALSSPLSDRFLAHIRLRVGALRAPLLDSPMSFGTSSLTSQELLAKKLRLVESPSMSWEQRVCGKSWSAVGSRPPHPHTSTASDAETLSTAFFSKDVVASLWDRLQQYFMLSLHSAAIASSPTTAAGGAGWSSQSGAAASGPHRLTVADAGLFLRQQQEWRGWLLQFLLLTEAAVWKEDDDENPPQESEELQHAAAAATSSPSPTLSIADRLVLEHQRRRQGEVPSEENGVETHRPGSTSVDPSSGLAGFRLWNALRDPWLPSTRRGCGSLLSALCRTASFPTASGTAGGATRQKTATADNTPGGRRLRPSSPTLQAMVTPAMTRTHTPHRLSTLVLHAVLHEWWESEGRSMVQQQCETQLYSGGGNTQQFRGALYPLLGLGDGVYGGSGSRSGVFSPIIGTTPTISPVLSSDGRRRLPQRAAHALVREEVRRVLQLEYPLLRTHRLVSSSPPLSTSAHTVGGKHEHHGVEAADCYVLAWGGLPYARALRRLLCSLQLQYHAAQNDPNTAWRKAALLRHFLSHYPLLSSDWGDGVEGGDENVAHPPLRPFIPPSLRVEVWEIILGLPSREEQQCNYDALCRARQHMMGEGMSRYARQIGSPGATASTSTSPNNPQSTLLDAHGAPSGGIERQQDGDVGYQRRLLLLLEQDKQLRVDLPRCHAADPVISCGLGQAALLRVLQCFIVSRYLLPSRPLPSAVHPTSSSQSNRSSTSGAQYRTVYYQGLDSLSAVLVRLASPAQESLVYALMDSIVQGYVAYDIQHTSSGETPDEQPSTAAHIRSAAPPSAFSTASPPRGGNGSCASSRTSSPTPATRMARVSMADQLGRLAAVLAYEDPELFTHLLQPKTRFRQAPPPQPTQAKLKHVRVVSPPDSREEDATHRPVSPLVKPPLPTQRATKGIMKKNAQDGVGEASEEELASPAPRRAEALEANEEEEEERLTPDLFAISWFLTLFAYRLPLAKVTRLWDFLFFHSPPLWFPAPPSPQEEWSRERPSRRSATAFPWWWPSSKPHYAAVGGAAVDPLLAALLTSLKGSSISNAQDVVGFTEGEEDHTSRTEETRQDKLNPLAQACAECNAVYPHCFICLCVALLLQHREVLLAQQTFSECLSTMTTQSTSVDVEELLERTLVLMQRVPQTVGLQAYSDGELLLLASVSTETVGCASEKNSRSAHEPASLGASKTSLGGTQWQKEPLKVNSGVSDLWNREGIAMLSQAVQQSHRHSALSLMMSPTLQLMWRPVHFSESAAAASGSLTLQQQQQQQRLREGRRLYQDCVPFLSVKELLVLYDRFAAQSAGKGNPHRDQGLSFPGLYLFDGRTLPTAFGSEVPQGLRSTEKDKEEEGDEREATRDSVGGDRSRTPLTAEGRWTRGSRLQAVHSEQQQRLPHPTDCNCGNCGVLVGGLRLPLLLHDIRCVDDVCVELMMLVRYPHLAWIPPVRLVKEVHPPSSSHPTTLAFPSSSATPAAAATDEAATQHSDPEREAPHVVLVLSSPPTCLFAPEAAAVSENQTPAEPPSRTTHEKTEEREESAPCIPPFGGAAGMVRREREIAVAVVRRLQQQYGMARVSLLAGGASALQAARPDLFLPTRRRRGLPPARSDEAVHRHSR